MEWTHSKDNASTQSQDWLSTKLKNVIFGIQPEIIFASLVINVLSLALPIVILQLYDRIIPQSATQTLTALVSGLVIIAVFDFVLRQCRSTLMDRMGREFEIKTTRSLVDRLIKSDITEFNKYRHSEYLDNLKSVEIVRDIQFGQNILAVFDLPFVVIFFYMIWTFTGSLVLIPIILFAVFMLIFLLASRSIRDLVIDRDKNLEERHNFMIEILLGLQTIKPLAMENQMLRKHEHLESNISRLLYKLSYINNLIQSATASFSQILIVIFVSFGAFMAVKGDLSVGALAAASLLAGRILQPATRVLNFWMQWQTAKISEEKILNIKYFPQEANVEDAEPKKLKGQISVKDLTIKAYESDAMVLNNINFTIEQNEFVVITGENGSGKSLLTKSLLGLVQPDQGEIEYDGEPLSGMNKQDVRSQIGVIPQRGVIFTGTILENMTGFKRGDAVQEAIGYAYQLGLNEELTHMANGLDTVIDSSTASNMPEGIRQRIVMVRALIGNPKILIMDDAHSGYDAENFKRLADFLKTIRKTKTVILISNHAALINLADICYRLDQGSLKRVFTRTAISNKGKTSQRKNSE